MPEDTFGNRLVLLRHERGLSLEEAADRAGLKRATWRTWEKGLAKPRDMVTVVERIAATFGYDAQWLAFGGPLERPEGPQPASAAEGLEVVRHPRLERGTRWLSACRGELVAA